MSTIRKKQLTDKFTVRENIENLAKKFLDNTESKQSNINKSKSIANKQISKTHTMVNSPKSQTKSQNIIKNLNSHNDLSSKTPMKNTSKCTIKFDSVNKKIRIIFPLQNFKSPKPKSKNKDKEQSSIITEKDETVFGFDNDDMNENNVNNNAKNNMNDTNDSIILNDDFTIMNKINNNELNSFKFLYQNKRKFKYNASNKEAFNFNINFSNKNFLQNNIHKASNMNKNNKPSSNNYIDFFKNKSVTLNKLPNKILIDETNDEIDNNVNHTNINNLNSINNINSINAKKNQIKSNNTNEEEKNNNLNEEKIIINKQINDNMEIIYNDLKNIYYYFNNNNYNILFNDSNNTIITNIFQKNFEDYIISNSIFYYYYDINLIKEYLNLYDSSLNITMNHKMTHSNKIRSFEKSKHYSNGNLTIKNIKIYHNNITIRRTNSNKKLINDNNEKIYKYLFINIQIIEIILLIFYLFNEQLENNLLLNIKISSLSVLINESFVLLYSISISFLYKLISFYKENNKNINKNEISLFKKCENLITENTNTFSDFKDEGNLTQRIFYNLNLIKIKLIAINKVIISNLNNLLESNKSENKIYFFIDNQKESVEYSNKINDEIKFFRKIIPILDDINICSNTDFNITDERISYNAIKEKENEYNELKKEIAKIYKFYQSLFKQKKAQKRMEFNKNIIINNYKTKKVNINLTKYNYQPQPNNLTLKNANTNIKNKSTIQKFNKNMNLTSNPNNINNLNSLSIINSNNINQEINTNTTIQSNKVNTINTINSISITSNLSNTNSTTIIKNISNPSPSNVLQTPQKISLNKSTFSSIFSFKNPFENLESFFKNTIKSTKQKNQINNSPPYLPPLDTQKYKYTIVLDLDETLIHFVYNDIKSYVQIRPFAQQFLTEISKYFEVVIFTAASEDYANKVLDELDKNNCISYKLFRNHIDINCGVIFKDLSKLGRDIEKVFIVDNNQDNFGKQPENGLNISSFYGDVNDCELKYLLEDLMIIIKDDKEDIRDDLRVIRDKMKLRYEKVNNQM